MVIWYKNKGTFAHTYNEPIKLYKFNKNTYYIDIGAGFDCETTKVPNTDLSFIYLWQFAFGENIYLGRDPALINDLLTEITDYINSEVEHYFDKTPENIKLNVFIANISFEWQNFKKYFGRNITHFFARDKRDVIYFEYQNRIFFRECLGVFGYSLADVCKKACKTQKIVDRYNYKKVRCRDYNFKRSELEYCINDVKPLVELWDYAKANYLNKGKSIPLTQTGIARNEVKDSMPFGVRKKLERQNFEFYFKDEQLYKELRSFLFSGGLTHSNFYYVGKVLENIKCKDLTSAYPAAMAQYRFPSGKLIKADAETCVKHAHYILYVTIENMHSKSSHSILSEHKCIGIKENAVIDNGRIYSATRMHTIFNEVDLANFKKIYDYEKIIVNKSYYFTSSKKCPKFLLDVMLKFYKMKKDLKTQGLDDTPEYLRSKQILNSLYGMLCTRLQDINIELDETNESVESPVKWTECNSIFNCYIGYWVTSYTRRRLVDVIAKFPNLVVQYDTDSIYHIESKEIEKYFDEYNKKNKRLNMSLFNDETYADLGEWDRQGTYKRFMALGSKRYIKENENGEIKITFAGAIQKRLIEDAKAKNIDIWEYMKGFNIMAEVSGKKAVKYFDEPQTVEFYNKGKLYSYDIPSCATICEVPFSANLDAKFEYLQKHYEKRGI